MTGAELKEWRNKLGLTQERAATELDVTRATIQNWEYETTSVPSIVDLACRQILMRWKKHHEYGPVTLVYMTSKPLAEDGQPTARPTLFCKRYSNNKSALNDVQLLRTDTNFQNPVIIDDAKSVIWSGPRLLEESEKSS